MLNDRRRAARASRRGDVLVAPPCESPLRRPADPVLALLLLEQNLLERHAARQRLVEVLALAVELAECGDVIEGEIHEVHSAARAGDRSLQPRRVGTRGGRSAACSRSRRAAAPSRRRSRPSAEPPSRRERRLPLQSVRPCHAASACTASSSHSRTRSAIMRSAASAHATAASGGSVRMRSKTVRDRDVLRMPSQQNDIGCRKRRNVAHRHPGRSRSDRPHRSSCATSLRPVPVERKAPARLRPTRVTRRPRRPAESRTTAMTWRDGELRATDLGPRRSRRCSCLGAPRAGSPARTAELMRLSVHPPSKQRPRRAHERTELVKRTFGVAFFRVRRAASVEGVARAACAEHGMNARWGGARASASDASARGTRECTRCPRRKRVHSRPRRAVVADSTGAARGRPREQGVISRKESARGPRPERAGCREHRMSRRGVSLEW